MKQDVALRASLSEIKRIVVKVGTRSLVQKSGRPDSKKITALVNSLCKLKKKNYELVLVTSGAIGSGMEQLKLKRRPKEVCDLQVCAAVGQSRLMTTYGALFNARGVPIGQVLLTHDDLKNRKRHLNARNTMLRLLDYGIVPVVNENDVVAVDEIKVGDNDVLAALVALLIEADLLVLLSTTDGLKQRSRSGRWKRIPEVKSITPQILELAAGKGSELSTGGKATKLRAAEMALKGAVTVVIADGRRADILERILAGKDTGTIFGKSLKESSISSRKKWIAFFRRPQGDVWVDDGAKKALLLNRKSLLPIGVLKLSGVFEAGAVVNVLDSGGLLLGRGLSNYSSNDLNKIKGVPSSKIAQILGEMGAEEAVHRDNLVLW